MSIEKLAQALINLKSEAVWSIKGNNGKEEEAISRLARVGFDNVVGFLDGGYDKWAKTSKKIKKIYLTNGVML